MEMFLAKAKPEEINKYLQQGWKVKMFQIVDDRYAGSSTFLVYIVLEKD